MLFKSRDSELGAHALMHCSDPDCGCDVTAVSNSCHLDFPAVMAVACEPKKPFSLRFCQAIFLSKQWEKKLRQMPASSNMTLIIKASIKDALLKEVHLIRGKCGGGGTH